MFGDLKAIVDVIRSAVESIKGFRDNSTRQNTALDLLRTYFLLMDIVKEGLELLNSVGTDPVATITSLPPEEAQVALKRWDSIVRRQGGRLYSLSERLLGQDVLAVIDPSLKRRLEELVSSKFERTGSLHGIGAGLVIYSAFGGSHKQDWLMNVVQSIYQVQEDHHINVSEARKEINQLQDALECYRAVCVRLVGDEEIMRLAKKAREETHFERDDGTDEEDSMPRLA
jgi:hypothetical protein